MNNLIGFTFVLITVLIVSLSCGIDSSFATFVEKNGNVDGKLYFVQTVNNNDISKIPDKEQISSYIEKGNNSYSKGKYEEAIEYFDNALGIDPSDTMALFKKGNTLDELGRYEEAIAYYDKVLFIDRGHIGALNNKGISLDNLGKHDEAITYYDRILWMDPDDLDALFNKATSLDSLGKYQEAITYFDKALAVDPNDSETLSWKGYSLYNLGRYSDAIKILDKVLEIDPYDYYSRNLRAQALGKTLLYAEDTNTEKNKETLSSDSSKLSGSPQGVNEPKLNIDHPNSLVTLIFPFDDYLSYAIIGIIVISLILFFGGLRTVRPTHRAAIERLSRYHRFMKSGITWIIPFVDRIYPVNVTEQMADADQQEIITKDNLNAFVDVQIYFKVKEDEESVKAALYNVNDYRLQIISLARTTLRNVIGNKEFSQVNNNRTELNKEILYSIQQQTSNWGLEIVRCELKEIQPPADVQQTMNTVLKAQNEKQAAIDFATARETAADGEKRAAIKQAEGQMQSAVLKAEGEAQAILKVAEARSKEIQIINEAADKYFTGNAQILKQLEVSETSMKDNTKFVIAEKGTNPVIVFGQDGASTNNVIVTKPKDKYPADAR